MRSWLVRLRRAGFVLGAVTLGCGGGTPNPSAATGGTDTVPGSVQPVHDQNTAIERILNDARVGTYLNEMIAEREPAAAVRWDMTAHRLLTVHLPRPVHVDGFQSAFNAAVHSAFAQWQTSGLPVRFDLNGNAADALIRLRWIRQFDSERTGEAFVRWVLPAGWIQGGTLTLSTHSPEGSPLDEDDVYAVALHEIGHLLGLGHSPRSDDVMHPVTRARGLSSRDRRTAQLLYSMPPGEIPQR